MKKYKLTKEEQDTLDSIERGEWHTIENFKGAKKEAMQIAENTLKKDARINIRLPTSDLERIKKIAEHEGLPYQTLIASVLHKFSLGRLKNVA